MEQNKKKNPLCSTKYIILSLAPCLFLNQKFSAQNRRILTI